MITVKPHPNVRDVFIEHRDGEPVTPECRCFRFVSTKHVEWARLGEIDTGSSLTRWYGFSISRKHFTVVDAGLV